jgi:hypothetical protein
MRRRDVYLKIEKLPGYSPVAPKPEEHMLYERDCMRGEGHEDGRIRRPRPSSGGWMRSCTASTWIPATPR